MYGFKKDDRLKPVITFVLYAGEDMWDGPKTLCDMMDFTDVRYVFDFIRCSTDKKKLLDLVENNVYYKQMEDDAYNLVTKYTNSKELSKKEEYRTREGKNDVCKAIKDLMADSRVEGIEQGIEQGTLDTLICLVKDNLLDIEEAAKRANKTIEEFQKELDKH